MNGGDCSPLEIDVRMRGDEVVVARVPEEVDAAPRLIDVLYRVPGAKPADLRWWNMVAVEVVQGWFVDVKEAEALAPTAALFADAFELALVGTPRVFITLPRYAGQPRWAIPAALHRAPKVAVIQCDVLADTALNQDPAAKGYVYWDDFDGSGWRTAEMLGRARRAGLRVILCSDEVYGRAYDVTKQAAEWRGAYGILTDFPNLWAEALKGVMP